MDGACGGKAQKAKLGRFWAYSVNQAFEVYVLEGFLHLESSRLSEFPREAKVAKKIPSNKTFKL